MRELPSPGGVEMTRRAIGLCQFDKGAKIADIGCGEGETVAILRGEYGFDAVGMDIDRQLVEGLGEPHIICGAAEDMPFEPASLDGLFFECSMSKMRDAEAVLRECQRVLRPGGMAAVSDLYARGEPRVFTGALHRIEAFETVRERFESAGFTLRHFVDCSAELLRLWGELIFKYGEDALCGNFGTDYETLKKVKCGYFLAVFALDK